MPMYKHTLTDDQAREILRLFYDEHVAVNILALLFPASKSTIYSILQGRAYRQQDFDYRRFPYNSPPANQKRTDHAVATARSMRDSGATYKDISRRVGVHLTTVRAWLVK